MARRTGTRSASRLDPASWSCLLGAALVPALLGWAGLAAAQPPETAKEAGASQREGELVACLLPAEIDRLGGQLTILGARQKIETSRPDCLARGGEVIEMRAPRRQSQRNRHADIARVCASIAHCGTIIQRSRSRDWCGDFAR